MGVCREGVCVKQPAEVSAFSPCGRGRVPGEQWWLPAHLPQRRGELRECTLQGGLLPERQPARAFTAPGRYLSWPGEAGRGAGSHLRVPLPPVTLEGKRAVYKVWRPDESTQGISASPSSPGKMRELVWVRSEVSSDSHSC